MTDHMAERGPRGDHGQDGHIGAQGAKGKTGAPGRDASRFAQGLTIAIAALALISAGLSGVGAQRANNAIADSEEALEAVEDFAVDLRNERREKLLNPDCEDKYPDPSLVP